MDGRHQQDEQTKNEINWTEYNKQHMHLQKKLCKENLTEKL